MEGWCGWGSVRVKGASHWPAPLCMDLLLYLQLYTSAVWYVEFLWGQCCRQQVFVCVCVWGGGVALTTKFRCPLVPSAPYPPPLLLPPVSLSARRWRFWFWIEGLSCRSGVRASHWRSWAFSWAGSAQRRRVERAPCTWPLRWEKKLLKFT